MKKPLALLLSTVFIAASVSNGGNMALAGFAPDITVAEPVTVKEGAVNSKSEPTDLQLENAITTVKKVIEIPKEYTQFDYYFNTMGTYADSYWSLTWRNPSSYAEITVNCDLKNHIIYYYKYDSKGKGSGVAKYLKSELKGTADAFIKKIAPEVSASLEYSGAEYDGIYSGNYVYSYQRSNNDVEFPDNQVSVAVNSITGEISYASVNWLYDVTVPSAVTKITKEEAAELIKNKMKMKLVYRTGYRYYSYDKGIIGGGSATKAFLVYEPTMDYISVDAKTGEVYNSRTQWIDKATGAFGGKESATAMDQGTNSGSLTDEEIAKIDELKNIISKSEAIKKVTGNQALYLEDTLTSYDAVLQKRADSNGTSTYVWEITLRDPRGIDYNKSKDYYRAYANATVDAKTGKILSFYSSLKSNYDEATGKWNTVKIPYDNKESKAILEKFLKAQIPDRFDHSVFTTENKDYIAYYKNEESVYGGYTYQYNRVNEGIEYPYNSIYGSVDGVTGKIYSYGSSWDNNIKFESAKGVMSAEEAMKYYLSKDGFDLKYEINTINQYDSSYEKKAELYNSSDAYSVDYKVRLVYRPDIIPSYISPFTGEQMDSNGEIYKETKPYAYKDIDNSEKNRNIRLLADMNIGLVGDNFLPDQNITVAEINSLLKNIGYSIDTAQDKDTSLITKEALAQLFIKGLGLDNLSKLSGIYSTGYVDEANIDTKYIGAVALARGLGIMVGDSSNFFNPKSNITRYDAVNYILNYVNTLQNRNF